MKAILNHLFEHKTLSKPEAKEILYNIAQGKYNNNQVASFLTVFMMRSITVEELAGFRDTLLELCLPVDLSEYDPIDLCGTGGDNKNTFNISTLSSFVVAGAGVKVAKHGNAAVTSVCGSSNVLDYFGIQFTADINVLRRNIEQAGICFLHAPLFHPAMKHVAPIRKALGVKTFFNMLGPMVNPSNPKKQIVGVFSLELARLYNYLFQQTEKQYIILHSLDVYDEISLTGPFKMISPTGEQILEPADLHLPVVDAWQISGGNSVKESAQIFIDVLKGKGTTAQNAVIYANAGLAIHCARPALSLEEAISMAEESLKLGKALSAFEKLTNGGRG